MQKVGIGIIGAGGITNLFHLRELSAMEDVEVKAVADVKDTRAKATAEAFGVPEWYTDYTRLLERDDIDAVIVATPHPTHAAIAVKAFNCGKHVLIQKPMATSIEDADRIVSAAEASGKIGMALPFNASPAFNMAIDMINKGVLGKICTANTRTGHGGPENYYNSTLKKFGEAPEKSWFLIKEKAQFGALFDMGIYGLSFLVSLLGPVQAVQGVVRTLAKEIDVEDNAVLNLDFTRGAIGTAEATWSQYTRIDYCMVYGTEGTLCITNMCKGNEMLLVSSKSYIEGEKVSIADNDFVKVALPSARPQQHHRFFIDAIRKGHIDGSTVQLGRHLVEIMLAACESDRLGKRIEIKSRF